MLYIIACSGSNYPEEVDELRKRARIFYVYMSTHSLISFSVPYIELGAWLQRRDEVKKDGSFPGGSLPCHRASSAIRVMFFNLWRSVTSTLLHCCHFLSSICC